MNIVILTGAGISAESGLGTFRDKDGLWTKVDLNEVAAPEGFARNPDKVHAFYNARRKNAADAVHHAAHTAIARLQKSQHAVTLITQNVDSLHERAGSEDVIHMHGRLDHMFCAACDFRGISPLVMNTDDPCPTCQRPSLRPDIVWFGEIPYEMDRIHAELVGADLFVAIGTSGTVYPAAGFVDIANRAGAETLELNLEPSDIGSAFADARYGSASEVVPAWVSGIINGPED